MPDAAPGEPPPLPARLTDPVPVVLAGSALWAVAAVALGLAMVAVALGRTRFGRIAAVFVLVAPLVEARLSTVLMDRVWPDYSAELATAIRAFAPESLKVCVPPA